MIHTPGHNYSSAKGRDIDHLKGATSKPDIWTNEKKRRNGSKASPAIDELEINNVVKGRN